MMTIITTRSNNNKGYKYNQKRKLYNKNQEREVSNFGGSVKTPVKMDAALWHKYDDVKMTM